MNRSLYDEGVQAGVFKGWGRKSRESGLTQADAEIDSRRISEGRRLRERAALAYIDEPPCIRPHRVLHSPLCVITARILTGTSYDAQARGAGAVIAAPCGLGAGGRPIVATATELRPWVPQAVLDDAVAKAIIAADATEKLHRELRRRVDPASGDLRDDAEAPTYAQVGHLAQAAAVLTGYFDEARQYLDVIAKLRDDVACDAEHRD